MSTVRPVHDVRSRNVITMTQDDSATPPVAKD